MTLNRPSHLTALALLVILLCGGISTPASAALQLNIQVSIGEHPFLPGYEAGKFAYLGDQWNFDVEVFDNEGDPAEGASVRFYNGSKSVGSGKVDSNGIASIKVSWTKLGTQKFRILASDSEPSGAGQTSYRIDVLKPRVERVFSTTIEIQKFPFGDVPFTSPDLNLVQSSGCVDSSKYWENTPAAFLKKWSPKERPYAIWPFTTNKIKRPWENRLDGDSYDQWKLLIKDGEFSISKHVDAQTLCQTDDGELIILK
jgi:hypothetical protein